MTKHDIKSTPGQYIPVRINHNSQQPARRNDFQLSCRRHFSTSLPQHLQGCIREPEIPDNLVDLLPNLKGPSLDLDQKRQNPAGATKFQTWKHVTMPVTLPSDGFSREVKPCNGRSTTTIMLRPTPRLHGLNSAMVGPAGQARADYGHILVDA